MEVLMPRLDPGMQSGKIVEWLKKEGDQIRKGEPIVVIEGEKTTFEVESPEDGPLTKILSAAGEDVQVSQPIAIIGKPSATQTEPQHNMPKPAQPPTITSTQSSHPNERLLASPAARRLAQEYGVELSKVSGTGPGGRISREDVLAASKQATLAKPRQLQVLKRTKLESIRKAVAERLSFSARNVVAVTLTMEADATGLVRLKERENHLSFTAFAVKAVAKNLEKHQTLNSSIEGEEIITYADVNVSVAIHTERGLVAPTITNANTRSLREISNEIERLAGKAKENQLDIEDLTGGTFTVTNLGAYDIESFAPVINPPQSAILGLGRIAYKPYAKGDEISARPTTLLTLVFDHRIVDGRPAAIFLQDVKRSLEEPESLL